MGEIKHLQFQLKEEEKEMLKKAGRIIGLPHSTFARMVSLREARKILNEGNKNE